MTAKHLRLSALVLLAAAILPACTEDEVPLEYRLEPGRRFEYRLSLDASISRTLSEETRVQGVQASFLAAQEVQSLLPGGGAVALVSLRPETLVVDGEPVEPGGGQEFVVELGPDGRVVAIRDSLEDAPPETPPAEEEPEEEETPGLPGDAPVEPEEQPLPGEDPGGEGALEPVGIERLLPRLRPVLPGGPVTTGETWSSQTEFSDEDGTFSVSSTSRLDRLGVTDGRKAGLVRTTYVTPVDRTEVFSNAFADVRGRDEGVQEAWFALEGYLLRATGDSFGRYDVTFRPPDRQAGVAPVEGALEVTLHTEMVLLQVVEP